MNNNTKIQTTFGRIINRKRKNTKPQYTNNNKAKESFIIYGPLSWHFDITLSIEIAQYMIPPCNPIP